MRKIPIKLEQIYEEKIRKNHYFDILIRISSLVEKLYLFIEFKCRKKIWKIKNIIMKNYNLKFIYMKK